MQLYVILRRNGFTSVEDLQEAAKRSTAVGDAPGSGVRWIRSYVLEEESGEVGTFSRLWTRVRPIGTLPCAIAIAPGSATLSACA